MVSRKQSDTVAHRWTWRAYHLGWMGYRKSISSPSQVVVAAVGRRHRKLGRNDPTINWRYFISLTFKYLCDYTLGVDTIILCLRPAQCPHEPSTPSKQQSTNSKPLCNVSSSKTWMWSKQQMAKSATSLEERAMHSLRIWKWHLPLEIDEVLLWYLLSVRRDWQTLLCHDGTSTTNRRLR